MKNNERLSYQKHYFPMADVLKLFCALMVVLIHCQTGRVSPAAASVIAILTGQAVPFFMIVSGFFVGMKIHRKEEALQITWKCAKNWLFLYFAWTVLWTPYLFHIYTEKYPDVSLLYLSFLFLRRVFLAGQGVYWYILILAEAVILLGIFVRSGKEKWFYALAGIGLLLGFLYDIPIHAMGADRLNRLVYTVFSWSNNVLMKGIPFVAIGYSCSQRLEHHRLIRPSILVSTYAVLLISMLAVYRFGRPLLCIFYPVQAVILFEMALDLPAPGLFRKSSTVCRELSSVIYYLHTILIYFAIDPALGTDAVIPVKMVLAVLGSVLIYLTVKKLNWAPLCWMLGIRTQK